MREARKRIRLLEQENEALRRAAAYLGRRTSQKDDVPAPARLVADGIPLVVSRRVLNVARQPYYRWLESPITEGQLAEFFYAAPAEVKALLTQADASALEFVEEPEADEWHQSENARKSAGLLTAPTTQTASAPPLSQA